jgi:hypothetical protein
VGGIFCHTKEKNTHYVVRDFLLNRESKIFGVGKEGPAAHAITRTFTTRVMLAQLIV